MEDYNELEDFDSIESEGVEKESIDFSNIYNVKIGGFGDQNGLKTYFGSLSVDNLEQDILFYETLSKDKSWPVSQIIQREVDKIRVSNISKDYIMGVGRVVKYFPPIIIAILPKTEDGRIDLKLDFTADNSDKIKEAIFEKSNYRNNTKLKELFIKAENKSLINGFYMLEVSKVFDFSILCWDKSKYYAIVIDGQHRMDSLIKSKKDNGKVKDYLQDVVFLEFSNLIKKAEESITPIEVVRRVFVDINTNAKKVGVVRQILMDDKDLASLLVQSLVDSIKKDGSTKNSDYYIESELVDWYGESLKHRLPHLTGVLSLYQILSDFLLLFNLSSINDRRSPSKVKNWVTRINEYFFIDKKIEEYENYRTVVKLSKSLGDYLQKDQLFEEIKDGIDNEFKETALFNFDYTTLEIAQESFEHLYAKGIVRFFNEFTPYKKVKKVISDNGGFNSDTLLNKALLSSGNNLAQSKPLQESLVNMRSILEGELNESYFLIYTVLGQKAVFNLLFKRIFKQFSKEFDEELCNKIVGEFLDDINKVMEISNGARKLFGKRENLEITGLQDDILDLGTIATSFWEGIIYEDDKIIYNSQGIQSLSSFIEYVVLLIEAFKNKKNLFEVPFEISYMRYRVKRILFKRFQYPDIEIESVVDSVLAAKKEYIVSYIEEYLIANK